MTSKSRRIIAILCIFVGIVLLVAGLLRGEAQTVLNKATRICLECIGIG